MKPLTVKDMRGKKISYIILNEVIVGVRPQGFEKKKHAYLGGQGYGEAPPTPIGMYIVI